MRSQLVFCGTVVLLLAACGAPPSNTAGAATVQCADAGAPHHAYVVVQHLSGAWMERCVGFAASSIDGQTAMDRSGIEYQAEAVGSGKVVCQVDQEPAQFSQCFPQNKPYWALSAEQALLGAVHRFGLGLVERERRIHRCHPARRTGSRLALRECGGCEPRAPAHASTCRELTFLAGHQGNPVQNRSCRATVSEEPPSETSH